MKQKITATEWLIEQVNSSTWNELYIWHKSEIYKLAKRMEEEQKLEAIHEAINNLKVYEMKEPSK